jgi:uncharacterized protein DUF6920
VRSFADVDAKTSAYGVLMLEQTTTMRPSADVLAAELPEPVRRYLRHALPASLPATSGVRLRMTGKIKLGLWLPFTTVQHCDGRSFEWRARVGLGPLAPLEVVDRYADGMGSVTGRLLGRYELFHQADEDVRRSAAGRAALEAILAPASLLPGRGVSWRAEDDEHIVASSYLKPEPISVHMQIDSRGSLRAFSAKRWGHTGKHSHGYLTFGGDLQAERRFGDLVVPSHLTAGWRYGSAEYKPFFHARIQALQPH